MEIIFGVLYTLLLDGCFEIISNEKINIVIRKIIFGIVTLFYVGLIVIFITFLIRADSITIKMIFILVTTLILALLIKLWLKIYKNKVT